MVIGSSASSTSLSLWIAAGQRQRQLHLPANEFQRIPPLGHQLLGVAHVVFAEGDAIGHHPGNHGGKPTAVLLAFDLGQLLAQVRQEAVGGTLIPRL
jgi:hypothetical protein